MRVRPYNVYAHRETLSGKPPVTGFSLVRAGKIVRKWNFADHKRGSVLSFSYGGFQFVIRITMKRYGFGKRSSSGFSMVKVAEIRAFKGTQQVRPPKWFKHEH